MYVLFIKFISHLTSSNGDLKAAHSIETNNKQTIKSLKP